MNRTLPLALVLAACHWSPGCDSHDHDHGAHGHDVPSVPSEYASLENPLAGEADDAAAGAELWDASCSPCHGATGSGDGAAGADMDPAPSDLADEAHTDALTDGYLFWRITEGGAALEGSQMPSYESTLSEDERWQVITHIRAL